MRMYETWSHSLFPKFSLGDFAGRAENVCSKKIMRQHLFHWLMDPEKILPISLETIEDKEMPDVPAPTAAAPNPAPAATTGATAAAAATTTIATTTPSRTPALPKITGIVPRTVCHVSSLSFIVCFVLFDCLLLICRPRRQHQQSLFQPQSPPLLSPRIPLS